MTSVVELGDKAVAARLLHFGIEWFKQNQFAEAIRHFDEALKLNPTDPYARWNRATALLSLGDYERGFPEHEVAWRLFHWRGFGPVGDDIERIQHLPVWPGGEMRTDTRVLVYHELGFGDAIMAFRFLPELRRRAEITLVIDQSLARLARTFDVDVATRVPDHLDIFDYRLPFFGVMSALRQNEHTIPAVPYIESCARDPERRASREAPIMTPSKGMPLSSSRLARRTIGIAWSGRTQTDFTLERFLQLSGLDRYSLHALQPGLIDDPRVEPLPAGCDFVDVLVRIEEMDHVVSVDTAAAHLAGAMGHPSAHLVLPHFSDWRWHHTERWYPTLKTYRQATPGDWATPFNKLNEVLHGHEQHGLHRVGT